MSTLQRRRLTARHEILWNPTCALDSFPECAAEFDRIWADRYPPGNEVVRKNGEWFKEMDTLALEIMNRAGVIPPGPTRGDEDTVAR